ncbi:glutamate racemase [Stomatohabitans albus]|uniref:glutamate racemase n=1 Tax=Stomatohabitans albus TaxID=3110766 RepID=UPI00300CED6B
MTVSRPVGIFDSGVGGLTVARSIIDLLPGESIRYVGDTARCPYGPRPFDEVRGFATEIVDWLHGQDVKLVIAACNTATAAAVVNDPVPFPVKVIGVIEPSVRAALARTHTGSIGVIGTEGTINSGVYERLLHDMAGERPLTVTSQASPEFVTFAEQGRTNDAEVLSVARNVLAPLIAAQVDTLILGCTHYPLLTGMIGHVMGPDVALISSAEMTARAVFSYMVTHDLLAPEHTDVQRAFYTTGDTGSFISLAQRFLGPRINRADVDHMTTQERA